MPFVKNHKNVITNHLHYDGTFSAPKIDIDIDHSAVRSSLAIFSLNLKSVVKKIIGHFVAENSEIAIIQDLLLNNVFQRDTSSYLIPPIITIF